MTTYQYFCQHCGKKLNQWMLNSGDIVVCRSCTKETIAAPAELVNKKAPRQWSAKSVFLIFVANGFSVSVITLLGWVVAYYVFNFSPLKAPIALKYGNSFLIYIMFLVNYSAGLILPVILVYLFITKIHRLNFLKALHITGTDKVNCSPTFKIAMGVIVVLVVIQAVLLLKPSIGLLPEKVQMANLVGYIFPQFLVFNALMLLLPFSLEISLRGYIFQGLRESFSRDTSAIIVTVMAVIGQGCLLSFNPLLVFFIIILNVTLIIVRIKTDNLTSCLIIHFTYNLLLLFVLWVGYFAGIVRALAF